LTLQVSNETAPAGGWAQIKVFANPPRQTTVGALTMDFDPTVFGDISNVAVFSATGDAAGYARVNGKHVDAHFSSPSGGIGQLPNLPVFVVSIPVLAGVPAGATSLLTLDPTGSPSNPYKQSGPAWMDKAGNACSTTVSPATFRVSGNMSVRSVTPGGGLLPKGTILQIRGAGFDSSTAVTIDGVSIGSTQLVSSQEIDATLGGATEMTGERVRLTNAAGGQVDYFLALPSAPTSPAALTDPTLHVLLPLTTYQLAQFGYPTNYKIHIFLALQNPTLAPVTVTFFDYLHLYPTYGATPLQQTITIPPGEIGIVSTLSIRPNATFGGAFFMSAPSPIRLLEYVDEVNLCICADSEDIKQPRALDPSTANYLDSPYPVSWNWQIGTAAPKAQQISLSSGGSFTVSVSASAQKWLSVTPLQGSAPANITLTPSVASLSPGTYTGTVTVTYPLPGVSGVPQFTILVALNVLATPQIYVSNPVGNYSSPAGPNGAQLGPTTAFVDVASTGGPISFTASVTAQSAGNWLNVSPASGVTPAQLTLWVNSTGLSGGPWSGLLGGPWSGQLTIQSATNTLTVPVQFNGPGDPSLMLPPTLAVVGGGASFTPGPLAPGELFSIFGMVLGASPAGFTLDAKGNLPTSINGTQVLVNGKPAPLLYASTSQINAIVPYEVGESGTATVQVVSNGLSSATWGAPAAPSAPAIFAADSSGIGQAAVLNQDNSLNGASNPATVGTTIQIFATGGGQTVPASITGTLAGTLLETTALPVTVTIGGADAPVTYHGSAPGEVAGLLQVNTVVPSGISPGPAVPLIVTVGGRQSQSGVTIAVR
jgi:uncharacterized protein (TIGR03437 family)